MKVTVVLPALNEAGRIEFVMEQIAKSKLTSEILVVDGGSIDETIRVAELKGEEIGKPCRVIMSEYRHCGKGAAMITGMKSAIEDSDVIFFCDSDISSITPDWVDRLVHEVANGQADECRGTFDRARDDALITKHITRPLLATYFPELSHIRQPLGGELALSSEIAEKLINGHVLPPTHSWGIDTWLLLNTSLLGGRIKEINLGEKLHKPKEISDLRSMLTECFREIVEIASKAERLNRYKEGEFKLSERIKSDSEVSRMRVMKTVNTDVRWDEGELRFIRELPYSEFLEELPSKIEEFGSEKWIRILHQLAKNYAESKDTGYRKGLLEVLFKLWSIYSTGYVLNHTDTFDEAEEYVDKQCKLAFEMRKELMQVK